MAPNPTSGRAYAFINCRQPKSDVAYIANDIKGMFAQEMPLFDRMTLRVNQGLTFLTARGRMVEARSELLKTVLDAARIESICMRPADCARIAIVGSVSEAVRLETMGVTLEPGTLCGFATAHNYGNLYAIRASLPNTPNKTVADELAAVVNQMYQSPLYEADEPFRGIITYLEKGRYVLRA